MKRREFLGFLTGLVAQGSTLLQAHSRRRHRPASRLERIGISSWSFHNYFASTREKGWTGPAETMVLLDFPAFAAERYKVHQLEFFALHLASIGTAYLQELKSQLLRAHSHLVNIDVDTEGIHTAGGLSDPDRAVRDAAVEALRRWIDIAARLGARSVSCDPGPLDPRNPAPTVDSYRRLAAYARARRVCVLVETRAGYGSEDPEAWSNLFKRVNNNSLGALPDLGDFSDPKAGGRGLALLFPFARTLCHAKGFDFDHDGNETEFDFPACVALSKRVGFRGVYSVEYEGSGDPYEGIQNVINELDRLL